MTEEFENPDVIDDLQEQFRAVLLGLAIGDALGAPLEFMHAREISERFGTVRDMIGGGWLNLEPGEGTDDTQMMLCLAESLAQRGKFDADDVVAKFMIWYDTHPKDMGNTTQVALTLIKNEANWRSAARKAHDLLEGKSAGNGSLMRVAPIGLLYHRHPNLLIEASLTSSKLTHWDELAAESCVAFNLILADLLHGFGPDEAIQNTVDKMLPRNEEVAQTVELVRDKDFEELAPTGFVLETLETALWHLLHAETFETALIRAVNMGGDADTIGAVTGALAGAYFGLREIPARWLDALQGRDVIETLADKLYTLSTDLLPEEEWE